MEPIDPTQPNAGNSPPESAAELDRQASAANPTMAARRPLGTDLRPGSRLQRGVIGEVTLTPALNTALRIGHEQPAGGWQQTEYVVLTPVEREALIDQLTAHRS